MKLNHYFIFMLAITAPGYSDQRSSLTDEREQIVHQYVSDLERADAKNISELFIKNGTVISTSKGSMNAQDFFSAFLPNIRYAHAEFHQLFINKSDANQLVARFHFSFQLKDGETESGEYVDEFLFSDHSKKLSTVAMFENLKFPN